MSFSISSFAADRSKALKTYELEELFIYCVVLQNPLVRRLSSLLQPCASFYVRVRVASRVTEIHTLLQYQRQMHML